MKIFLLGAFGTIFTFSLAFGMSPLAKEVIQKHYLEHGNHQDAIVQYATNALWRAIESDDVEALNVSLNNGANASGVNAGGLTPLLYVVSAKKYDIQVLAALVKAGANLLATDRGQNTVLHLVVSSGIHLSDKDQARVKRVIKFILASAIKADPLYAYRKNAQGYSVFDCANRKPESPIAKLLMLRKQQDQQNSQLN